MGLAFGVPVVSALVSGYRIIRPIGTGARSRIFLAEDVCTGQRVAVKRVPRDSAEDDRYLQQTQTEFDVASRLGHPVLRRMIGLHRIRRLMTLRELVLVMEYVDGLTLDKARPNRLDRFLKIFARVAEGLDAMHRDGFIHGDIKPNNIMRVRGRCSGRDGVKIIDFGQSCRIGHRKERIQGTPDYIAPEQVSRRALDQRTDVFNLGATMYWVLTSRTYPTVLRASNGRGELDVADADRPLAPIEINEKIPPALSKLIMECCRANPAERPSDMRRVLARLEAAAKLWARQREALKREYLAHRPTVPAPAPDLLENIE